MRIVRANIHDLDKAAALFNGYRQFYQQEDNLALASQFIKERLSKKDSVLFMAINEQDEAMGFTQLYPSFSSVSMKPIYILNDLYVAADYRKQHVAESLMNHAKAFAHDEGCNALTLQTAFDNHQAQALYNKLGYKKVEQFWQYRLGI